MKGFDPETWIERKQARRMARFTQLAVAAAAMAIEDARLVVDDSNRDDIAVVVNTGGGGIDVVAHNQDVYRTEGGRRVSPFVVPMF